MIDDPDPPGDAFPSPAARLSGPDLHLGAVLLYALLVVLASAGLTLAVTFAYGLRLTLAEQAPPDGEDLSVFARGLELWFPVALNVLLTLVASRKLALRARRDGWLSGMLVGGTVALVDLVAVVVMGAGDLASWAGGLGLLVLVGWLGGAWGDRTREYRLLTR